MGLYTLTDFRDEIQLSTGNRGLDNTRLTRYVNFAYFEIVGSVDFETLVETSPFSTVVGQSAYSIPSGSALVKAVVNLSLPSDGLLGYRDMIEYYRTNRSANGVPRIWARQGDQILLAPYPSSIFSMSMILKSDPDPLVIDSATTELPTTWDPGVSLLATHYAKMSLGDADAASFYNRAVQYLASRVVDEERNLRDSGLGQSIGRMMQQGGA